MTETIPPNGTWFAPAGRASDEELDRLVEIARNDPLVSLLLEAVDGNLLVLNEQRQVLAANPAVLEHMAEHDELCLVGLRPGEVLDCVHYTEGPDGCGTAKHCATCGAVISVVQSQRSNGVATSECRMAMERDGRRRAAEFKVRSTPMQVGAHKLTVLLMQDVSSEKRREVLERVFFHDVLNTIGGIRGWTEKLTSAEARTTGDRLVSLVDRLVGDIGHHRAIFDAESDTMVVRPRSVAAEALLAEVETLFRGQPAAEDREIVFEAASGATLITDPFLMVRVLNNMVKNAVEATPPGGRVRVWFDDRGERPGFFVHNPGAIPGDVARHVFERAFSTKGEPGRGLGTYSMKLLGERYLHCEVSFTTSESEGTTFCLLLPAESTRDGLDRTEISAEASVWSTSVEGVAERAANLTAVLRGTLHAAASGGYVDRLDALLDEVERVDAQLASALREMVERYDYEALIAAVKGEQE